GCAREKARHRTKAAAGRATQGRYPLYSGGEGLRLLLLQEGSSQEVLGRSLKEEKKLEVRSAQKMSSAAKRKEKVIHDMVSNLQDASKRKVDKVASMRKKEEFEDIKKLAELEKRAQAAETNRHAQLSVKSSAAKKRQLSPRLSPTTKVEIEAKINQAAERRELQAEPRRQRPGQGRLHPTGGSAAHCLFSALSPSNDSFDTSSDDGNSPRIKAARLSRSASQLGEKATRGYIGFIPVALGSICMLASLVIIYTRKP
ncbi:hypothetical protein THAOC_04784, partial [Thalassiosira oceanica]